MFRLPLRSLAATLALVLGACAEPSSPIDRASDLPGLAVAPALGACDSLAAPEGSRLVERAYATGVQIYKWTGAGWTFLAPRATLYASSTMEGQIGTHYAGPTWESNAGGTVVGAVAKRCTPDAHAIPWLLLKAASTAGPGRFARVTFIQRVATTGGLAPSAPGAAVGEIAEVPYTATYYFYR